MRHLQGSIILTCLLALLLPVNPFAAAAPADPGSAAVPVVRITARSGDGMRLSVSLPPLERDDVRIGAQTWQRLQLPGGAVGGRPGEPALPVYGRLVAVPEGMTVRADIVSAETSTLTGLRLVPVPERPDTAPVADPAAYGKRLADSSPRLLVGEPARLRDLRVVPVTIVPVAYDPVTETATVARRLEIDLRFVPDGKGAGAPRPERPVPASFATLYDRVLGADLVAKSPVIARGTYLVVCPDDASVVSALDPLLQWRREQGYHVVLATTSETGTTNTQIRSYIQDLYQSADPPLEFVTLVGDANGDVAIPTWNETLSGYGGEGDNQYVAIDGFDPLPDVHIGRLSVASAAELATVVDKIVGYETAPPTDADPGWFTRATLVGDPSESGITTIFVNQWVKTQLLAHGYAEIDTIWSGNFVSDMMTDYGKGGTLFTYRGWYGMSGLTSSYILNLGNGDKLGFAVIMTCDTGSFQSDGTCRSEAFLRATGGGGVASIGTATIGTHTRYNNCMFTGVIDGVYNSGDFRVGPALSSGKLAMYRNYNAAEPEHVEIWCTWNNLMGDPATEIWTARPGAFQVDHPSVLSIGANVVPVSVTDPATGLPIAGATVALYKSGEIEAAGITDADGSVRLPVSGYTAGDLHVTVTAHDRLPYRGTIGLGGTHSLVGYQQSTIDDSAGGNGDGTAQPGETIQLAVRLHNYALTGVNGVTATLGCKDPLVTVVAGGPVEFGDIAAGGDAWGATDFTLAISPAARGGRVVDLDLVATDGTDSWSSLIRITLGGGATSVVGATFAGGSSPQPGDSGSLTVTLGNDGDRPTAAAAATLFSRSPWVTVTDAAGSFPAVINGATADNGGDPFAISIAADCLPGHLAGLSLRLAFADGTVDTLEFALEIGTIAAGDPIGPDGYGYYIFDDTDTAHAMAPTYDWIEIDPALGGSGTDLGLQDSGFEQDDVTVVDLPFALTFYGESFDRISVCSNGWIAMGVTYLKGYRNWSLPTSNVPDGLICAFWDDLYDDGGSGGVYGWYDAANGRYVIEWSRMTNRYDDSSTETFEIVLYDPARHGTDTGDAMIDIQYRTVANVDPVNGYATVGLMNLDHTDGLTYTYWNRYTAGAATLAAGRALRILAVSPVAQGIIEGTVTNASLGGTALPGATITVLGAGRLFATDASGHYAGGAPVGTYDIVASAPGFAPDTTRAVAITADATTTVDFSLVDVGGPLFSDTTALPDTTDTTGPYVVETTIADPSGLDEVHCYYLSTSDGGPHEVILVPVDGAEGRYRAVIPGQPLGTRVRYWLTASDDLGHWRSEPADAPAGAYAFWIRDTTIMHTEMEYDGGWTAGADDDDASTGLWTRADPNTIVNGTLTVVPEDDHTPYPGTDCWLTGNDPAGSSQGADDVDGGKTTLLSSVFDLTGYSAVTVSYYRWYTNDTGFAPGEDEWVVQVTDDGTNWVDLERTTASDRSWRRMSFDLTGLIAFTPSVRFRFIASDYGSGSVVEALVDDFRLEGLSGTIDTTPPVVTLLSPNGGESYATGDPVPVSWTASDDTGVTRTLILFSRDGGITWPDTLADGALTSPTEVTWPVDDCQTAALQVVCLDASVNIGADTSDATFTIDIGTGAGDDALPRRTVLGRNHPNPFNPRTEIRFVLPREMPARLRIYDISGRLVATLVDGRLPAGEHVATWNGRTDDGGRAPSGVYFSRLTTPDGVQTRKMTLVK